mmetsp:Transcript_124219/g.337357  ORF Transcript_124219/g.337357 Transcript_124219/m.337357 type:complete len:251 (-) Transcript_124219:434-1186(-)
MGHPRLKPQFAAGARSQESVQTCAALRPHPHDSVWRHLDPTEPPSTIRSDRRLEGRTAASETFAPADSGDGAAASASAAASALARNSAAFLFISSAWASSRAASSSGSPRAAACAAGRALFGAGRCRSRCSLAARPSSLLLLASALSSSFLLFSARSSVSARTLALAFCRASLAIVSRRSCEWPGLATSAFLRSSSALRTAASACARGSRCLCSYLCCAAQPPCGRPFLRSILFKIWRVTFSAALPTSDM